MRLRAEITADDRALAALRIELREAGIGDEVELAMGTAVIAAIRSPSSVFVVLSPEGARAARREELLATYADVPELVKKLRAPVASGFVRVVIEGEGLTRISHAAISALVEPVDARDLVAPIDGGRP